MRKLTCVDRTLIKVKQKGTTYCRPKTWSLIIDIHISVVLAPRALTRHRLGVFSLNHLRFVAGGKALSCMLDRLVELSCQRWFGKHLRYIFCNPDSTSIERQQFNLLA